MSKRLFTAGLLTLFGAGAAMAAPTVTDTGSFDGNTCFDAPFGGDRTGSFNDCTYTRRDGQVTPFIIKFNVEDEDEDDDILPVFVVDQRNTALFPSVDGSEFEFDYTGGGTGTFTYTAGAGDPGITAFVAKGGPGFRIWEVGSYDGATFTAAFVTPINPRNDRPFGLSNISFFDTRGGDDGNGGDPGVIGVPAPAGLALLGVGLLGLALAARRRQRPA